MAGLTHRLRILHISAPPEHPVHPAICDEASDEIERLGRLLDATTRAERPTSFGNYKWACGHEGPSVCAKCWDEKLAEIKQLKAILELIGRTTLPERKPPVTKFRKKPVVIEAFQMTEARRHDRSEDPDWLQEAFKKGESFIPDKGAIWPASPTGNLLISTLEGDMEVSTNDWIIRGVQGELYPCKPDIFKATYEKEC